MLCSNCGAEVPENFEFCAKCGARLTDVTNPQNHNETAFAQASVQTTEAQKAEKTRKTKMIVSIVLITIIALIMLIVGLYLHNLMQTYKYAEDLLEEEQYDHAIEIFTSLGNFRDSPARVTESTYLKAKSLYARGNYEQAKEIFTQLGDYKDSADMLQKCNNQIEEQERQEAIYKLYRAFGLVP